VPVVGVRWQSDWRKAAGALAVVVGTLLALHLTNGRVGHFYGEWESAIYVASVDHPLRAPIDPYYGYRLLPALLVRLLPIPHPLGFLVIDYVSLAGAALLLIQILTDEDVPWCIAVLAAVLFLSFPCSTKWLAAYSAGTDAFYLLLIAVAYRCIQLERWCWFSAVLLLGMFTKVSILVLVPVAYLHPGRPQDRPTRTSRSAPSRLLSMVPAVAAFVLVERIWPPGAYALADPSIPQSILKHVNLKLFDFSTMLPGVLPQIVEMPMSFPIVFGIVALLLVLHARESGRILASHPAMCAFLFGTILATFMGSYDTERCEMYGAVPVLFVWSRIVRDNLRVYGRWWVVAPLLLAQGYLSEFGLHDVARYQLYQSHYMAPEVAVRYLATWAALSILIVALTALARRT
jgi:hypothetical protein